MDINNKIRDTFNPPPSLEGEDWLTPSASVWDEIEKEIKPKKRNRLFLIIFLILALLSITTLAFYFGFYSNDTKTDSSTSLIQEKTETNTIANSEELKNNSIIVNNILNTENQPIKLSDNNNNNNNNNDLKIASLSNYPSNENESELQNLIPPPEIKKTTESNQTSNNVIFEKDVFSKSSSLLGINFQDSPITSKPEQTIPIEKKTNNFSPVSTSLVNHISTLYKFDQNLQISINTPIIKVKPVVKKPRNSILFSVGASIWDLKMNENYSSALEPANFNSTNASGYYTELGYKKYITSRFFTQLTTSFQHVEFQSGHNSVVDYSISNEAGELNNSFDLVMASPIGFLGSNIEITRRGLDVGGDESLTIDLHNSHKIGTVDGTLQIGYEIIQRNRLNASIQGGLGYSYLLYNTNNLDEFDIESNDFVSSGTKIISDQENINKLRPNFSISSSINYRLTQRSNLFLQYTFGQDLKNIYQFTDFSTRISRQHIGLGIQFRL